MALYHLSAKIISRSNGQSAVGAAAYRSGEKLTNEYDGITHDYRKKQNVEFAIVMLPTNAPPEFADREKLWNAIEQTEKQANAQLAREIEFSLPRELPAEVRKQIALEYIQEQFVDNGMIADVCFHNPPKMDSQKHPLDANGNITKNPAEYVYENPHCHCMLTLRPLDENGKWEAKKQKLYVCERDGVRQNFSSEELKKNPGWEKLYNYKNAKGKKDWFTKSYVEAHPEKELELVNRYPKCEQVVNPKVEKWNSSEMLIAWREAWAVKANDAFKAYNMEERIDHRSYKDQGVDFIPTIHEGKAVTIAEKRLKEEYDNKIANGETAELKHTEIRDLNEAIREHNQEIRIVMELKKLRQQLSELLKPVKEKFTAWKASWAERLEKIRVEIIKLRIRIKRTTDVKGKADEAIKSNEEYIRDLSPIRKEKIDELRSERNSLKKQLDKMTGLFTKKKKAELQERIEALDNEIKLQTDNRKYVNNAKKEIEKLRETSAQAGEQLTLLKASHNEKVEEYRTTEAQIPADEKKQIQKERLSIRASIESESVEHKEKLDFKYEAEQVDKIFVCSNSDLSRRNIEYKRTEIFRI